MHVYTFVLVCVQLLQEERDERERRLAEMEQRHQKGLEEALQNFKTSVAAERQVNTQLHYITS